MPRRKARRVQPEGLTEGGYMLKCAVCGRPIDKEREKLWAYFDPLKPTEYFHAERRGTEILTCYMKHGTYNPPVHTD